MKVSVVKNIKEFKLLEKGWNELYSHAEYSVFQSFDFCYNSVLKSDNIFVIICSDRGMLCEIWPCVLKDNKLEFINQIHADFCDVLTIDYNKEILDFILESDEVKSISFKNIQSDSNIHSLLLNVKNYHLSTEINYSILKLCKTDNFPSNFTHFVYRQRRRLKRILKKYDGEINILHQSEDKFPKDEIVLLRNEMIALGKRDESFLQENLMNLIESLYLSQLLKVSILKVQSETVAISLFFQEESQFSFWIDLFDDKQMINLYHNTLFIKEMTLLNESTFNFGRGDYSYKVQNFLPDIFPLYNVHIFKNKFQLFNFILNYKFITFVKYFYRKFKK